MSDNGAKTDYVVGVDLGGTKIMAGVFDSSLECLGWSKISTKAQRGPDAVVDRIARCISDAVDECDLDLKRIKGVGIGAPGSVEPVSGRVLFAPNLQWEDVPLKKDLEKLIGTSVFVENDCNMSTLGVYEKELKSKPQHMVGIFLGTGVGAGLILNGQLFSGFNRTAGEIGHMVVQIDGPKCGCGNKGCFEAFAGRSSIFNRIQSAVKEGQKTILTDMLGDDLQDLRSGDLRKAIRRGDKFVEKIIKEVAEYTGVAVGNLINILNPEVIVLGGGLMEALEDEMLSIITETAFDIALPGTARGIQIQASKLGDDAGIVGCAVLARQATK